MTAWRPATAMVLAAGLGVRMRPLTDDRPKPLVQVGGKALIDWVLDDLDEAGVTTAIVNIHYRGDQLRQHLAHRVRPAIVISDETDELLDTGGGVANALSFFDDKVFLVTNSDALWGGGLAGGIDVLSKTWSPATMESLLLLAPMDRAFGFPGAGDFNLSNDGTPVRRGDKASAPMAYAGTQIVHRRLFSECPDGPFSFNLLWDKALAGGRLKAVLHDDDWYHVGTPDAVAPTARALGSNAEVS